MARVKKWTDGNLAREQLHAVRRESILREAARCFNRKGYHGTTIDDIARQLNVSTAALYYYFKRKEDILFQCHQMALEVATQGLHIADASGGPADDRLRGALQYYIEHITDALSGCVALLEEGALSAGGYREIVRRRDAYESQVRQVVEEGIASDVFVPCDAKMMGFAILGAVTWIPKWYRREGTLLQKEIARILSTYLVRGLQKRPTPEPDLL